MKVGDPLQAECSFWLVCYEVLVILRLRIVLFSDWVFGSYRCGRSCLKLSRKTVDKPRSKVIGTSTSRFMSDLRCSSAFFLGLFWSAAHISNRSCPLFVRKTDLILLTKTDMNACFRSCCSWYCLEAFFGLPGCFNCLCFLHRWARSQPLVVIFPISRCYGFSCIDQLWARPELPSGIDSYPPWGVNQLWYSLRNYFFLDHRELDY